VPAPLAVVRGYQVRADTCAQEVEALVRALAFSHQIRTRWLNKCCRAFLCLNGSTDNPSLSALEVDFNKSLARIAAKTLGT